jgi:glycosyltransferase involved in cell wall biosynthesis
MVNPRRILADGRWAGPHGIGRFSTEVLSRLSGCAQFTDGPRPLSVGDPLWLSWQIGRRRPDAFFTPGFNVPAVCRRPCVITIHDLAHIQLPFLATGPRRLYYSLLLRPAALRAHRVITVSEFSRRQILEWSGLPPERVVNAGNGVAVEFQTCGDRYQPGFPYVLYVGCARPHKNLDRLLRAFRASYHRETHLLLTGSPTPELGRYIQASGLTRRVHFLGVVSDGRLAALYRGASVLVLPSLMEGFGLPALEAMACGTPVIASNVGALPEVVGEAGLLVDPTSVSDITSAIDIVLGNFPVRKSMREAGQARARCFQWDKVAAKVQDALDSAAGG